MLAASEGSAIGYWDRAFNGRRRKLPPLGVCGAVCAAYESKHESKRVREALKESPGGTDDGLVRAGSAQSSRV